jgi:hypothetical protein
MKIIIANAIILKIELIELKALTNENFLNCIKLANSNYKKQDESYLKTIPKLN